MDDDFFDKRLKKVDRGTTIPAATSLRLLFWALVASSFFFFTGIWLGCLAFLIWVPGAAIVATISASGAICGLLTLLLNANDPKEQGMGLLGTLLNGMLCAGCVIFLSSALR